MFKGGLVVGGEHGRGVHQRARQETAADGRRRRSCRLPAAASGRKSARQAIDLILVVNNQRGLEQLVRNQFKLGADAAVAAGPVGREASASTDIQMRAQILQLFAHAGTVRGRQRSTARRSAQDRDANERFYGRRIATGQIVFDGLGEHPAAPDAVAAWKAALTKYAK